MIKMTTLAFEIKVSFDLFVLEKNSVISRYLKCIPWL